MNEKILVLAYPGLGKTFTADHYANISDFEQQFYTYIYDDAVKNLPLEQIKSDMSKKTPNPDWPNNFIKGIGEELEKGKIVITTLIPKVYKALCVDTQYENTRIILVVFDKDNFEELADRFRARGNAEEFIERRRKDFPVVLEQFENAKNVEKVIAKSGEYLADALISHGIKLIPGKGSKNYL